MFDLSWKELYQDPLTKTGLIGIQFEVVDKDFVFCNKLEMVRQHLRNLLSTWTGQWFMNVGYGIDYKSQLGRSYTLNLELTIKSKVLAMPEVSQIISYSSSLVNRILTIKLSVEVQNQVLNFTEQLNV